MGMFCHHTESPVILAGCREGRPVAVLYEDGLYKKWKKKSGPWLKRKVKTFRPELASHRDNFRDYCIGPRTFFVWRLAGFHVLAFCTMYTNSRHVHICLYPKSCQFSSLHSCVSAVRSRVSPEQTQGVATFKLR